MASSKIRQLWLGNLRKLRDRYADIREDISGSLYWRLGLAILLGWLLLVLALGIYWSRTPAPFAVEVYTAKKLQAMDRQPAPGAITTATLIGLVDVLLNKPGGYLSNDIMPPGVWLDNMPNWEYGLILQLRDINQSLVETIGYPPGEEADGDLALALSRFRFSRTSWIMPSTESRYREGQAHLREYLNRLTDPDATDARFTASAETLEDWLARVDQRLQNLSRRLSASVGESALYAGEEPATGRTPRTELDDIFFEARGTAWALIHLLQAVERDFAGVLNRSDSRAHLRDMIVQLQATQQTIYSPIILNGRGFGLLANHSLVMNAYIANTRGALEELRNEIRAGATHFP